MCFPAIHCVNINPLNCFAKNFFYNVIKKNRLYSNVSLESFIFTSIKSLIESICKQYDYWKTALQQKEWSKMEERWKCYIFICMWFLSQFIYLIKETEFKHIQILKELTRICWLKFRVCLTQYHRFYFFWNSKKGNLRNKNILALFTVFKQSLLLLGYLRWDPCEENCKTKHSWNTLETFYAIHPLNFFYVPLKLPRITIKGL